VVAEGLGVVQRAAGMCGHFLTKSQHYSTTFRAIRDKRRTWRLGHDLTALDRATEDPNHNPIDPRAPP
jgi:hypothetical protein